MCTCSLCVHLYSGTKEDIVQEYLIPAMKRGSLKVVCILLTNISNAESILRELPQSRVEELAINIMHDHYSEEVSSLCVCVCVRVCVCACACVCVCMHKCQSVTSTVVSLMYKLSNEVHISVLSPTAVW